MKRITIGEIINAQGIKGEVRVMPLTDDNNRFHLLSYVFVEQNGVERKYLIESVRLHKQFVLLKLENIDTRTEAENLKKSFITIKEEDAVPLEENEYFIKDLFDMKVITEEGEEIGVVKNIYSTSAHDIFVIEDKKSVHNELLLPATELCIKKIDIDNNCMTVFILEGLRELKKKGK